MRVVIIADGFLWKADPSSAGPGMPIEENVEKLKGLANDPVVTTTVVTYLPQDTGARFTVLNNWLAQFLPDAELHVGYEFPRWDRLIVGQTEV